MCHVTKVILQAYTQVAEMESRSRLALEGEALKIKVMEAASAHTILLAHRDELQANSDSLEDKWVLL